MYNRNSGGISNSNNINSGVQPPPTTQQFPQQPPIITVTVQRDYKDIITKFERQPFPDEISRNGVSLIEYEFTINEINRELEKAETVDSTTVCEELFGCLTFFSIFLFYDDKYKKCLKRISRFIEEQNQNIYNPKGITWVNPMSNGFLKIDILVRPSSAVNSNSEISSSSTSTFSSVNSTPSTIPTTSNNNNNNNNGNNSNDSSPYSQNINKNYNNAQSSPFKPRLNLQEKEILKPETIINVVTNNNIVELSDEEDDDDDDEPSSSVNNNNNNNNNNENNI